MHCGECGVAFYIPEVLKQECKRIKGKSWYCPNGHPRIFGESLEETVLILRKDLAEALAARDAAEQAKATLLERVRRGVCPDCHRTFQNLARHVATKHRRASP
jgi:hypothetical protein